ncbi:MAG: FeoC-like transcriptional regulator [Motilibacteraceae bacterium]
MSAVRPLRAVLDAFDAGAASLAEVSRRTGLDRDVVDAAVDHLVRLGRLSAQQLAVGCPPSGCGGCASGAADGGAGCGAEGPSAVRSGPVLVALSVRRPTGGG